MGPFVLLGIALALAHLTGDQTPLSLRGNSEFPALSPPVYWLCSILFYGFGEETGWRGYLLSREQRRYSPVAASLRVAVVWMGWHLPLFWFAPGMASMGVAGVTGWAFSMIAASVVFTWLWNGSGGSVPAVAIFHGTMDIAFLAEGPARLPSVLGGLITCAAVAMAVTARRSAAGRGHCCHARTWPPST